MNSKNVIGKRTTWAVQRKFVVETMEEQGHRAL
jgi:hypothetical protein